MFLYIVKMSGFCTQVYGTLQKMPEKIQSSIFQSCGTLQSGFAKVKKNGPFYLVLRGLVLRGGVGNTILHHLSKKRDRARLRLGPAAGPFYYIEHRGLCAAATSGSACRRHRITCTCS